MDTQQLPEQPPLPPDGVRIPAVLRPEDITEPDFPAAMRGYDREAVERRLRRIAADYKVVLGQRDRSQALAAESSERAMEAEAEVHASARDLAALSKVSSELERDLDGARARIDELERAVAELEAAPPEAVAAPVVDEEELQRTLARVAELESEAERLGEERERAVAAADAAIAAASTAEATAVKAAAVAEAEASAAVAAAEAAAAAAVVAAERAAADAVAAAEASAAEAVAAAQAAAAEAVSHVQAEVEPDRQVGELLGAALRAAETLRTAAREEAQRTLKKARERSSDLERQTARQARALEKAKEQVARLRASAQTATAELERAREAQEEAERQAEHVKETMQAEVEQTVASLEAQRERVQTVLGNALTEALAALQSGGDESTSLFADLSARLSPMTVEDDGTAAPEQANGAEQPDAEPAERPDQA